MPQCSTCGSVVSDQEKVCPDCGMELGAAGPQSVPGCDSAYPAPSLGATAPPTPEPAAPPAPVGPAPQIAGGAAKLTLRRGGVLTGEVFHIGPRVVVGRFDVSTGPVDLDLGHLPEGAYLSRRHAELWRDASGVWHVKDLGSQNGTFVRPASAEQFQRVTQEHPISDGDEIAFGNARFEFRTC